MTPPQSDAPYRVCVVGMGKIGLPLAVQFASNAMTVLGADINEAVVHSINSGVPHFPGEDQLAERLGSLVEAGVIKAVTNTTEAVSQSNVVVIVVPLVVDHESKVPNYAAIDAATAQIALGLQPGTLVVYETTLPVGTTRNRFAPALAKGSGLTLGTDLYVCFSPERVSSGRIFADLRRYPKLVGGMDAASTEVGVKFYQAALEFDQRPDLLRPNGVWEMDSCEAAELAKLAETTYRDINIAFANELARHCDSLNVDVSNVIAASNSQPFSHIHQPGIAVGGHCIPVYPHLYLQGDPDASMPRSSRSTNDAMPDYCVRQLDVLLHGVRGKHVVVLGLAYRGGVKETAFSGAWAAVESLAKRGAIVSVHDPLYTDDELRGFGFIPYHLGEPVDGAIVQTDHHEYRSLSPQDLPGVQAVFDGRSVLDTTLFDRDGVRWQVLGRKKSAV